MDSDIVETFFELSKCPPNFVLHTSVVMWNYFQKYKKIQNHSFGNDISKCWEAVGEAPKLNIMKAKTINACFCYLLDHLYGRFMENIGLKAPGNYSASI